MKDYREEARAFLKSVPMLPDAERELIEGLIDQEDPSEGREYERAYAISNLVTALSKFGSGQIIEFQEVLIDLQGYIRFLIAQGITERTGEIEFMPPGVSKIEPMEMVERKDARYTPIEEKEEEALRVFRILKNAIFKVENAPPDRKGTILEDAIADLAPSVILGEVSARDAATMLFEAGHYTQAGEGELDWTSDDAKAIIDTAFPGELDNAAQELDSAEKEKGLVTA